MKRITIFVITALVLLPSLVCSCGRSKGSQRDAQLMSLFQQAGADLDSDAYRLALPKLLEFIKVAQRDSMLYGPELVSAYSDVGDIMFIYHDDDSAHANYRRAYQLNKVVRDTAYMLRLCHAFTQIFMGSDLSLAHQWNDSMLVAPHSDKHCPALFYHLNMMRFGLFEKQLDSVPFHFYKAVDLIEPQYASLPITSPNHLDRKTLVYAYLLYSYYFDLLPQADSAMVYAIKAEDAAEEVRDPYLLLGTQRKLVRYYSERGDLAKADEYQRQYMITSDSLMNTIDFQRIRLEQERSEKEDAYRSVDRLTFSVHRLQFIFYTSVVLLLLAALTAGYIFRQKRLRDKNYQLLFERHNDLLEMERTIRAQAARRHREMEALQARYDALAEQLKNSGESDAMPETDTEEEMEDVAEVNENQQLTKSEEDLLMRIRDAMSNPDVFCDPDFGLAKLTSLIGSNTRYVSQVLRKFSGKSFRTRLNEFRIREACRRMLSDEYNRLTLRAIAESVGYNSQNNFNRIFKQITGMTPVKYRQMAMTEQTSVRDDEDDTME